MLRTRTASLRQSLACRYAARVTLLFFALRAMLPAGYMPEIGALEHGQVRIVICTGGGTQTLLVDEAGRPVKEDNRDAAPHGAAGDCAFGMATAQAFTLPQALVLPDGPGHASADQAPGRVDALRSVALGPPLGPRAPPVLPG